MKKKLPGSQFIFLFLLLVKISSAQTNCEYFPADCPDNDMLQQQAESKWQGPADLKVKEEYAMQDNLRQVTMALMDQVSKKTNWKYYLLLEDQDNGIGIDGNTKPLPYPLRRPCQWGVTIIFIVNEDSLLAWRNWYNNDLLNASTAVVNAFKQGSDEVSKDDIQKKYSDSANYYGNQKTKYMSDHSAEYQKAVMSNDAKGQKKFEDGMKWYDDRINACIDKANGKKDEDLSSANKQGTDLQEYRHKKAISYRNASTLRVTLIFNQDITPSLPDEVKIVKPLSVPNTSFAALFHNPDPDPTQLASSFLTNPEFAFVLLGKWLTKPDQDKAYHAAFFQNKEATDAVSVKKISCDKVQTISLGIEGNQKYINQFLQSFDTQTLNKLIVNQ